MVIQTIVVVLEILFLTSCSNDNGILNSENSLKRVERKVTRIAEERHIPSLEVTIDTGSDFLSFGYSNPNVQKQSIYGIGSATKLLSAVFIFQFVEKNEISIDDVIIKYIDLNDIKHIDRIETVTIKQLLNHTSGLSDFTKHPEWIKKVTENNAPETFQDKLLLVSDTLKDKGTFSYSNTNYLLLEKIVEAVTNENYMTAFDNFFENNGLNNITLGAPNEKLEAYFAVDESASSNVSSWREYYGYAGDAYATTNELNQFLQKLLVQKSMLEDNTLTEMEQWISMAPMTISVGEGEISEYGNGVMKLAYKGNTYIGHFGSTLKYQSFVFTNVDEKISVSVVTNCSGKYYNNVFFQELIPAILDEL